MQFFCRKPLYQMIFHHLLVMLGNMVKFFIVYQTSHGRSVAVILYNNFPEFTLLDVQSDDKGRKVMVNIKTDKMVLTLISIHAPSYTSQRIKFCQDSDVWIRWYSKAQNTVIGGDFNCCDKSDRQSKKTR